MIIRTKSRQELAEEYNVCRRTLTRWIKKEGLKLSRGLLYPKDVALVYETFGPPVESTPAIN